MRLSHALQASIRTWLAAAAICALAASLVACQPKKTQLLNSCSCTCKQQGLSEVRLANKDFYSDQSCTSFQGKDCGVEVKTDEGSYTVSGKWEGCQSNGKAQVSVLATPDQIPTVAVSEDDILPLPPPPPRQ